MKLLLDTHVFFWFVTNSALLDERHRRLIADRSNMKAVSAVTGWEIALKFKLGKWPGAQALLPDLSGLVARSNLETVDITLRQAELAGSLDLVHRDPFDRLLAAQSIDLGMPILTVDAALARLGCKTI